MAAAAAQAAPARAVQPTDATLAGQAGHAGRMLELAYAGGDRELALIWQQAMFSIVKLRKARRFGLDTHSAGGCLGG